MDKSESLALGRPRDRRHWVYAQLYPAAALPGAAQVRVADRILLELLAPEFAHWQAARQPYFFIRYQEGGYHLRVRVYGATQRCRAGLRQRLRRALAPCVAEGARLCFAAYQPELEKYGGALGNRLAEQHFRASSDVALRVLAGHPGARGEAALRLMQAMLAAAELTPSELAVWCQAYYDYWWRVLGQLERLPAEDEAYFLAHQQALLRCLGAGPAAGPEQRGLALWSRSIQLSLQQLGWLEQRGLLADPMRQRDPRHGLFRHPQTCLSLLPNFLHMLNNRLGLTVRQEMRLAHCLMRATGEPRPAALQMSLIPT